MVKALLVFIKFPLTHQLLKYDHICISNDVFIQNVVTEYTYP